MLASSVCASVSPKPVLLGIDSLHFLKFGTVILKIEKQKIANGKILRNILLSPKVGRGGEKWWNFFENICC